MQNIKFEEHYISRLGFGAMRLPLRTDGKVAEGKAIEMIQHAMYKGINYFDTAYPYHNGQSETVLEKALRPYPRDSYFLADKFPGHQIADRYEPGRIFEKQLKKCGVDYFDFYLLHNVYENSIGVYTDEQWGILEYFVRQREMGRIRHLGFSSHGRPENLEEFLQYAGSAMEFCQIQLNYLDWTLQEGEKKYDILDRYGLPVWVMEPVRGGRLANLSEEETARLSAMRPGESPAAWSFRWLMGLPNVKVIISGMSTLEQVRENLHTFSEGDPLSEDERALLLELAEGMKDSLPCTGCGYCLEGCPQGLDIPRLISGYNDVRFGGGQTVSMQLDALPADKLPSACIGCGACNRTCPQKIDIAGAMTDFTDRLSKIPKWADICEQRKKAMEANERRNIGIGL